MNSPFLLSLFSPHAFPSPGRSASGSVGDPARDKRDGVGGPLYSAFVIGRGPEASDDLLEAEGLPAPPWDMDCSIAYAAAVANDGRRLEGAEGIGELSFDSVRVKGVIPPPNAAMVFRGREVCTIRQRDLEWRKMGDMLLRSATR